MENKEFNHGTLPLVWGGWDYIDTDACIFYDVKFFEDFGRVNKDDTFKSIMVDNSKGIVEFYDEDGQPLFELKVKLVVCD